MKTVWIVLNAGVGAKLIGIFEQQELIPVKYTTKENGYVVREIPLNAVVNEIICY